MAVPAGELNVQDVAEGLTDIQWPESHYESSYQVNKIVSPQENHEEPAIYEVYQGNTSHNMALVYEEFVHV